MSARGSVPEIGETRGGQNQKTKSRGGRGPWKPAESLLKMRLNPKIDSNRLRDEYAKTSRVQIQNFLEESSADRLYSFLSTAKEWRLHVNQQQGDKLFELLPDVLSGLGKERVDLLHRAIHNQAKWGFQFCFEAMRTEALPTPNPLADFLEFLGSKDTIELLRFITGADDIHFADAQATAYGSGHFLTAHDDSNEGQARLAAYVMNLTPAWRLAWGGILQFHGEDGNVESGWVPTFNVMNLFSVPQPHSVSFVTPFAPYKRYSVTGWLRSRSA